MMRNKSSSSLQKTYDECYLICSTAVYFEGQNNEAEALRSWRSALDQIYYHNAYKVPTNYVPRSETEKALFSSLKQLELQCKERVDLLEVLKKSRKDAEKAEEKATKEARKMEKNKEPEQGSFPIRSRLSEGPVLSAQYPDLSMPLQPPTLPPRPSILSRKSTESMSNQRTNSLQQPQDSVLLALPPLPVPTKPVSRSPSPSQRNKRSMLMTLRSGDRKSSKAKSKGSSQKPGPLKAAGMAWDTTPRVSDASIPPNLQRYESYDSTIEPRLQAAAARRSYERTEYLAGIADSNTRTPDPGDQIPVSQWRDMRPEASPQFNEPKRPANPEPFKSYSDSFHHRPPPPPPPPPQQISFSKASEPNLSTLTTKALPKSPDISYRNEFPPSSLKTMQPAIGVSRPPTNQLEITEKSKRPQPPFSRKPLNHPHDSNTDIQRRSRPRRGTSSGSGDESTATSPQNTQPERSRRSRGTRSHRNRDSQSRSPTPPSSETSSPDKEGDEEDISEATEFENRKAAILTDLPKNIDILAATQILNEIIVHGDEVHWSDVAGLEPAKKALKEAVVYPFLRPDLFMGLREPARGMLLFGPPGTGKTMLARAVATESKSTFFAISASSLTSKWHGESEKLVRALFAIARRMAPSIIFVDEIDSLLGARGGSGGSEHEASRRSKTEFLIQWSDLQKAAAGKDTSRNKGEDPTRVLVLAATNVPWDIDEAARRRFVRRQYIPLPEAETRETQLRTLLGHQKHGLKDDDIQVLVHVTEGFSGSDITSLAKDAAMGPLRNLGEALLFTPMDQIRPIAFKDFEASLENIRPSVSQEGLKEYEKWAATFGERGG